MTTFPRSLGLLRDAPVTTNSLNTVPNVIVFRYNPDTLTRTLQAGDGGDRSEAIRLKGASVETIGVVRGR